ncbi:G-PROTEIN-RECEP-F1-2 domain-containing protein [Aphelenchoides besseyi]|nr:G-PROTEIN-RECEP-F1-2 domain-containing protein [Aphelenchoides besseyi]KAI6229175.1 G-PROTEIN-RECEP-F1-2 domain-containing protein [Aphelenchoides besseyi]
MHTFNGSRIADWDLEGAQTDLQSNEEIDGGGEYLVVLPILVIVGLVGNIVSLVTILNTRLRKATANQYLIVLTASDSVFLIGMILIVFKIDYRSYYSCVVIEYILMCSSYVSSWSIVALTIERYIAIAHPLQHVKLSHIPRTKIMLYWVPVPLVLNLVQFVSLTPNIHDPNWPDTRRCAVQEGSLQMTVEMLDVFLSYITPCVAVVLLNSIIASTVRRAGKGILVGTETSTIEPQDSRSTSNRRMARNSNLATTRILLVVPVVYTLLNTPFYLMRILDTLALNLFNSKAFSIQELSDNPMAIFFYNAAHYLYYVNFASDFIVYAFSSANFRKSVCLAWSKLLCPSCQEQRRRLRRAAGDFETGVTSQRTGFVLNNNNQVCRTNGSV